MHPGLHRDGRLPHDRGVRPLPHVVLLGAQRAQCPRGPLVGVPLAARAERPRSSGGAAPAGANSDRSSSSPPGHPWGQDCGGGGGVPAVCEDVGVRTHYDVLNFDGVVHSR